MLSAQSLFNVGPTPRDDFGGQVKAQKNRWEEIAASQEFARLIKAKMKLIVPALVLFIVYYFALPVLVGYAPKWMERKVIGNVNLAYLFALSQFFMAWGIAAVYLRAAARFDAMSRKIIDRRNEL